MKAWFIAVAIALLPHSAQAGDSVGQARSEAAGTVVDMLGLERTLDSMFESLKGVFADAAIGNMERGSKDGQMATFFQSIKGGRDRFAEILGDEFVAALRTEYPDFKKAAANEYAAQFSLEELQALAAFFQSEAGAKWLTTSPKLEKSMGEWGRNAGMKAGAAAFTAALQRVEVEKNESKSQ